MKRITILMVILCTCLVSAAWAQGPHRYTVTDLGTLGGTYSQQAAGGISNSGWVLGIASLPDDTAYHAVLWKKGVLTDLGTLGGPNSNVGYQVSDSADTVGGAEASTPDPQGYDCLGMGTYLTCLPFHWQNGVMTALPTLGGHDGFGLGINNLGVMVGWSETSTPDTTCGGYLQSAVIWIKGQVYELPLFPGDWNGAARLINDNGQIAGWSGGCGRLHALLWQNGTRNDLGSFGGTIDIGPFDIQQARSDCRVRRSVYCVEPVVICASYVLCALFMAPLIKHGSTDVMGDARIYAIEQSSFA